MRALLLLTFITSLAFTAKTQVFWTEDFSNGIPADWSNEDLSGIGLEWTYCADTTTYGNDQEVVTCPFDFTDCDNRQNHFSSNSPENGFACCVTEPFFLFLGDNSFDTRLTTSAIDCSFQSEVYVMFNSHIGVFDLDALENAFLRVSTDRVNWISFTPFPDLITSPTTQEGFRRWSFNPEPSMFDISAIAANQETVYLQWYWQGNREYHWSIDDILLTNQNPFPDVDISLSPDINFHGLVPNFSTPVSQIEPVYFLTDAVQFGLDTLRNVEIIATVTNTEGTESLWEESVFLDELIPNENYFDITFPPYTHTEGVGVFKVTYSISQEIEDGNISNNIFEYPFEITDSLYRKHLPREITKNVFPLSLNNEDFIERNWGIANYFHVPNGANMSVDSVYFEIPNRFEITDLGTTYVINEDITINITLFRWDNTNSDDFASEDEYSEIGFAQYDVTGGNGNEPQSIKLGNLISDGNIPLEDNQDYFLALDYIGTNNIPTQLFAVKASLSLNYDGTIQSTFLQDQIRYGALTRIGDTGLYDTRAFGGNVIPNIWFSIAEEPTATSTQVLPSNTIRVSPNPTNDVTTITFDLKEEQNVSLELLDINGRLIRNIFLAGNQAEINCANLANGTYLVKYNSDTFSALQKLVVLH